MFTRLNRAVVLVAISAAAVRAQTPYDGLMMPRGTVMFGAFYSHDAWDHYWEGTLKRGNGNIGTLTTQAITWVAGYAVADRLNVMAAVPYIWTHASQGVLHDMSGIQDLTAAAKYRLLSRSIAGHGVLSTFIAGAAAFPMSHYSPDFMPLSIGSGGSRASARLTIDYDATSPWFATASGAYTFCNNVRLNRDSYFTNGQLYLTNQVAMPNVIDYTLTAGLARGAWRVPLSLTQQLTLGGSDIRRQDMPFVSNRMDFVRVEAGAMYAPRALRGFSLHASAAHVLSGRNVGQSTTITSGLMYAIHL
jgi:hypothetical protein